jgi:nicotinamidase-related amidase
MILDAAKSQLIVVDMQEKLLPAMTEASPTVANVVRLLQAARQLDVPFTLSQQYPRGLGVTIEPVMAAAGDTPAIFDKLAFSCARDSALSSRFATLAGGARRQIVICGIEAHVCVLQTALDLAAAGHAVAVVVDAVTSRMGTSKEVALRRMEGCGVMLVTTEMVIFEWLGQAGTPSFKALSALVR